jgi:membrane associated rhomboid family serine protease
MGALTPWVQRLLIANVVMFFVTSADQGLFRALWFYPPIAIYKPWTLATYMFLHGSIGHLFFNMLGLFFFGSRLETRLGSKSFLWLYFLAGVGGALFQTVFASAAPMVGASGAIYGLLIAYAYFWPREKILVMFVIPMEIWLAVTLYVFYSLYAGMGNVAGGIAHFAHLGGAAIGFGYLKWWEWRGGASKRAFKRQMTPDASSGGFVGDRMALARWKGISIDALHELNREEVQRLVGRATAGGPGALTEAEKEFLDRMSAG